MELSLAYIATHKNHCNIFTVLSLVNKFPLAVRKLQRGVVFWIQIFSAIYSYLYFKSAWKKYLLVDSENSLVIVILSFTKIIYSNNITIRKSTHVTLIYFHEKRNINLFIWELLYRVFVLYLYFFLSEYKLLICLLEFSWGGGGFQWKDI